MSYYYEFYYYILPGIIGTFGMMTFLFLLKRTSVTPQHWDLVFNGLGEKLNITTQKYSYLVFIFVGSFVHPLTVLLCDILSVFESDLITSILSYSVIFGIVLIYYINDQIPKENRNVIRFSIILAHIIYALAFHLMTENFGYLAWKGNR